MNSHRQPFAGEHRDRQVGVASNYLRPWTYREDKEGRQIGYFVAFVSSMHLSALLLLMIGCADSDDTAFDCGAVTTALVNAAWSRGLGCVINSQYHAISCGARACKHFRRPGNYEPWPWAGLMMTFPQTRLSQSEKSVDEARNFLGFED